VKAFDREPGAERRLELPRHPGAAAEARRFVESLAGDCNLQAQTSESAVLVSSELVTNAVQHGRGKIELRVQCLGELLRIEVIDEGHDQTPAIRHAAADGTGGRGLRIVEHLAVRWGVFEGTTHVWADLRLS
jgi:anti-sigma regulatory factor (Ser/Thr protein kinase)